VKGGRERRKREIEQRLHSPFALHAPIQWAIKRDVIEKRGISNVLLERPLCSGEWCFPHNWFGFGAFTCKRPRNQTAGRSGIVVTTGVPRSRETAPPPRPP